MIKNYLSRHSNRHAFFLLFLASPFLFAQQYLDDGGFEANINCPKTISNLAEDLENVWTPTDGTTDYFNTCGNEKMGVPENFKGVQEASQGEAYAGMYLYAPNDYREYLQFKLDSVFEPGQTYKVKFDVSLSETSKYSIRDVSVLFSSKGFHLKTNKNLSFPRLSSMNNIEFGTVKLNSLGNLGDSDKWVTLEGLFEARGYESHLTFGNFKSNKETKTVESNNKGIQLHNYAYYYVDNVSVEHVPQPVYEMGKPYVLDHVIFEFDHFKLTERAKRSIKEVFKHLRKKPDVKLVINGHTDNIGPEAYNKYLSSRRARAVALYLIELGLSEKRISWEGHGDKKPLYNDFDDAARKANRRVEFVITEFEDDN